MHVLYFWNDLHRPFGEIARVLKPGGKLALFFRTSADVKTVQAFPAKVYRFRSLTEVTSRLEAVAWPWSNWTSPRQRLY